MIQVWINTERLLAPAGHGDHALRADEPAVQLALQVLARQTASAPSHSRLPQVAHILRVSHEFDRDCVTATVMVIGDEEPQPVVAPSTPAGIFGAPQVRAGGGLSEARCACVRRALSPRPAAARVRSLSGAHAPRISRSPWSRRRAAHPAATPNGACVRACVRVSERASERG